ncbi:MAG: helix-turn-helix transcriptional regulator [Actinomycetota bacterium]
MPRIAATPRLERLLALVPWVMAHPAVTVTEVCERFKITREELAADLDLLFMCGLPPFGPGDLIVAFIEGDQVVIREADYLARPLKLTRWEAVRLLVTGRALARLEGVAESKSLDRALSKLEAALTPDEAAAAAALAERVGVDLEGTGAEPMLGELREAIAGRRRLHITYYSFGRDEISERDIDPYIVFAALGNWYVSAHDHLSDEDRVFRVDRIKDMTPTGVGFELPEGFDPAAATRTPLFVPSPLDVTVTLDLAPAAGWVREITPHDHAEIRKDGWTRMRLRTSHLQWITRLVLRLGEDARVVGPEELAVNVREAAAKALEQYGA